MKEFKLNNRTNVKGLIHQKTIDNLETEEEKKNYIEYRDKFDKASNFKKIYDYPIHIDLEIDNICNFACSFCPIGQPDTKLGKWYQTKKEIPKEKIFEIIDECKEIGVNSIQFSLVNEPLANKNIFEILKYTTSKKFEDVFIVSNGSLLDEKRAIKLLDTNITKIQFSLDAFKASTYEKNRFTKVKKPGLYEKVKNNIINFINLRNKLGKKFPLIRVSFIELEENIDEINDFDKFWSSKVDAIHYQKLTDYKNKLVNFEEFKDKIRCNMSNFRLSIKADGNVRPCCVGYGEEILVGNIYKNSLKDIWHSKVFKDFQKMHLDYRSYENPSCKKCLEHSNLY